MLASLLRVRSFVRSFVLLDNAVAFTVEASRLARAVLVQDSKVVSIAVGAMHSLAVTTDGQVFAWGSNVKVPSAAVNARAEPRH